MSFTPDEGGIQQQLESVARLIESVDRDIRVAHAGHSVSTIQLAARAAFTAAGINCDCWLEKYAQSVNDGSDFRIALR